MNVTSLLNAGQSKQDHREMMPAALNHSDAVGTTVPTAVHTPTMTPSPETTLSKGKEAQPQPPKVNRIPWHGDGEHAFSLPVKTTGGPSHESTTYLPMLSSPKSPKHKISDSKGSLTSYTTSSTSSQPHSRISSLDTVADPVSWPSSMHVSGASNLSAADPKKESSTMHNPPNHSPTLHQSQIDIGQPDFGLLDTDKADAGRSDAPCLQDATEGPELRESVAFNGKATPGWGGGVNIGGQDSAADHGDTDGDSQDGDADVEDEVCDGEDVNNTGHGHPRNEHAGYGQLSHVQLADTQLSNGHTENGHSSTKTKTSDDEQTDVAQFHTGHFGREHVDNGHTNAASFDATLGITVSVNSDEDAGPIATGYTGTGPSNTDEQLTRAKSPSDIAMIKRGGGEGVYTESSATASSLQLQRQYPVGRLYTREDEPPRPRPRTHTRAVSAPNLPGARAFHHPPIPSYPPSFRKRKLSTIPQRAKHPEPDAERQDAPPDHHRGPIHDPTSSGPRSHHSKSEESHDDDDDDDDDGNGEQAEVDAQYLSLASDLVFQDLNSPPQCMYMDDCNTGSQLRKAISHIFGRNKVCTRQIPDNIWVHFCRKHYQRCRYRNSREYAMLQCKLVIKQIERVQAWSDSNQHDPDLGIVHHWTLSIRKREQRRIAENKTLDASERRAAEMESFGGKRPYPFHRYDGLGYSVGEEELPRPKPSVHAVPDWLLQKVEGSNFTTAQVIEIFWRIHAELSRENLQQTPDIEILPTITHNPNAETVQYKRYQRRTHMSSPSIYGQDTTHHRPRPVEQWTQFKQEHQSPFGSSSGFWNTSGSQGLQGGPAYQAEVKRQRIDHDGCSSMIPRTERTVPNVTNPWGPAARLPAPVAQGLRIRGTPGRLEGFVGRSDNNDPQRQGHQRSMSDATIFQRPLFGLEAPGSRFTPVNGSALSSLNSQPMFGSSFDPPDIVRQGNPYGSGVDSQHNRGHTFGAGASSQLYNNYSAGTSGQSYSDLPPQHQHPSFVGQAPSNHQQQPSALHSLMANSQGHARHQSDSGFGQASQQEPYASGSTLYSNVVPEGYPPPGTQQPPNAPGSSRGAQQ